MASSSAVLTHAYDELALVIKHHSIGYASNLILLDEGFGILHARSKRMQQALTACDDVATLHTVSSCCGTTVLLGTQYKWIQSEAHGLDEVGQFISAGQLANARIAIGRQTTGTLCGSVQAYTCRNAWQGAMAT